MNGPVSKEGFFYAGTEVYVEVKSSSSLVRHGRAELPLLVSLLKTSPPAPLLTPSGRPSKRKPPPPPKDRPGHWYSAQLLHYGLRPTTAKATAKKRLLEAIESAGGLVVPDRVLKIELELKEQYKVANEEYVKRHRKEKDERRERERREKEEALDGWAAVSADTDELDLLYGVREESEDETGEEDVTREFNAIVGKGSGSDVGVKRKRTDTASTTGTNKRTKKGDEVDDDPSGSYEIFAPYITEQWDHTHLTLSLAIGKKDLKLWGSFDFGIYSGIFRFARRPPTTCPTASVPFEWRGRESGEGEMEFGDDCKGELAFLGGGRIRGTIGASLWGDSVEFAGRKTSAEPSGGSAESFGHEWKGYNEAAYEGERVSRWH